MDRTIVLSDKAKSSLNKIFSYLDSNWPLKVKQQSILKLESRLEVIANNPRTFPASAIKKGLHKCIISKHSTVYYTYDEEFIYVLTVFDTRSDPDNLTKDLI